MALFQLQQPSNSRAFLELALLGQAGGAAGGLTQGLQQHRQQQALGQLLAGKAGPGLGALTRSGAPGLDPNLAGPSLGMTQGKMAQPGMLHTGGQITPQMAQAFMLQGGNPAQMAQLMPKPPAPIDPIDQARLGIDYQKLDLERQKLAQPPDPTGLQQNLIAAGYQPGTPEFQQKMNEILLKPQTQISLDTKVPAGSVLPQAQGPRTVQSVADVASAFVDPQTGAVDKTLLAQFDVPGLGSPIPGTPGARLRSSFDEAVNTLIYLQTGKAATDEERAATNAIYKPSVLDSPGEVTDKLNRLQGSIQSFLEVSGRGLGGASEVPNVPQIPEGQGQGLLDQAMQWGGDLLGLGGGAQAAPAPAPAQAAPAQKPGPDATFEDLVNFYAGGGRF